MGCCEQSLGRHLKGRSDDAVQVTISNRKFDNSDHRLGWDSYQVVPELSRKIEEADVKGPREQSFAGIGKEKRTMAVL